MTTENERLRQLMKVLNFSNQTDFAAALGIKQGSLSDVFRGKGGVGVSDSIKRILEKEHSINIDWLETGNGEVFSSYHPPKSESVLNEPPPDYWMGLVALQQETINRLSRELEKANKMIESKQIIIDDFRDQIKKKDAELMFIRKSMKHTPSSSAAGGTEGRQAG